MNRALYRHFFPNMLIFLQKCISNHETKQSSKFQSDPSPNCFTINVWNINCWRQHFIDETSSVAGGLNLCFYRLNRRFWCRRHWEPWTHPPQGSPFNDSFTYGNNWKGDVWPNTFANRVMLCLYFLGSKWSGVRSWPYNYSAWVRKGDSLRRVGPRFSVTLHW